MKERQQLAEDGVITVAAAIDWSGKLMAQPEIHLRGVVTQVETTLLQQLIVRNIENTLSDRWDDFCQNNDGDLEVNWTEIQLEIEASIRRLVKRELRSNPLVVFLLQKSAKSPSNISSSSSSRRRRRSTASVAISS